MVKYVRFPGEGWRRLNKPIWFVEDQRAKFERIKATRRRGP